MSFDWSVEAHRLFKEHGVRQVGYVPDGGLTTLIESCIADNDLQAVAVTTEEEAIGLSAGAWLGGDKCAVMMQSSGVGNTINAIASVTVACQFPLFMIVTMRGQFGESNPWQMPMAQATPEVLRSLGMHVIEVDTAEDARDAIHAGLTMAYGANQAVAVLIGQKLIGAKPFVAKAAVDAMEEKSNG